MMTDPIADMLTRIRNAQAARHEQALVPFSKLKFQLANLLEREHYIKSVSQTKEGGRPVLAILLKYNEHGKPAITKLRRISKPGRRVYSKADDLPRVLGGYGIALVSTPAGLMTNKEARKRGLGGEVLCEVY